MVRTAIGDGQSSRVISCERPDRRFAVQARRCLLALIAISHAKHYGYDVRSRPITLTYPGNYQRRWIYNTADADSTDAVVNVGTTTGGRNPLATLRATTCTYDARGNRLTADDAFGLQERQRYAYSGLGHVTSSNLRQCVFWSKRPANPVQFGQAF